MASAAAAGEAEAVVAGDDDLNSTVVGVDAGDEGDAMEEDSEREEAAAAGEGSPEPGGGGRRKASFQKLWTEADEAAILEGFLEFVTVRGTTHADYQHGTGPFFEAVKPGLSAAFSTSQLVEKLRRLKRKYRNTAARIAASASGATSGTGRRRRAFVFRSPHDEATYEISRKIWSPTFKRGQLGRPSTPDAPKSNLGAVKSFRDAPKPDLGAVLGLPNAAGAAKPNLDASNGHPDVPKANLGMAGKAAVAAEEESNHFLPGLFAADSLWPVPEASAAVGRRLEGRWREQRILELEVFLKRVELVRERVAARLDELRRLPASANATGNGNGIG